MENKSNNQNIKLWIGVGIGLCAVIVAVGTYALSRHAISYSTVQVGTRNLAQTVRVSGSVVADQESSLSFSAQGKIAAVNVQAGDIVHKGDILAYLDTGTVKAQLDGAIADLSASEAQLSKVQSGSRPEELALYQQKYNDASSALLVAMNNAYIQASDAVNNKANLLFTNGTSVNPNITIRTQSSTEEMNINQEHVTLNDTLNNWKQTLANTDTSTSSISSARAVTQKSLSVVQTFLNHLSTIATNLSVGNSGLSQTTIDADMAIISGAQQELTSASTAYTTADAAWSSARDSLTLQNAGSREEDIATQSATMQKAQAQVEAYQSALRQSYIVAPFDGTVTEVNMKVGEVVVPGFSADENIGIINTNHYKVETYVPENAIGTMVSGNFANVTFDAYGSSVLFPAHVYLVSPAETVKNGVNSYKVTLYFDQTDIRIRSGLTANVEITTATATDALAVPSRAIITKGDQKYVLLSGSDDTYAEHQVTTGITSSDGYTQILSGLSLGDTVANFGTQQSY